VKKIQIIKSRAILAMILFCAAVSSRLPSRAHALELKEYPMFSQQSTKKIAASEKISHTRETKPQEIFIPASQNFDFEYVAKNIFLADPRTKFLESDIDIEEFLAKDFSFEKNFSAPQILIFHAHSMEMFADSTDDPMTGVFGVGKYLADVLQNEFGLRTLHHTERFDVVDGIPQRQGSYERLEPSIRKILADNPSIEMVIDLHRDGVGAHVAPMVTEINGKRTAQIMFVNGLQRRYRNGEILPVTWLENPYRRENLAFSFNLQLAANNLYPGFARRIYLLEYRYSLHMVPRSILLEVGAQNNTFQEALNAVFPIAKVIASVVS